MDALLEQSKPPNWGLFCASNGWCCGWKKRYRVTSQCQTNKKSRAISVKLPWIKVARALSSSVFLIFLSFFHSWFFVSIMCIPVMCV